MLTPVAWPNREVDLSGATCVSVLIPDICMTNFVAAGRGEPVATSRKLSFSEEETDPPKEGAVVLVANCHTMACVPAE